MLKWMKLRNLALVEEAEVEFGPRFNVITGETGAGKSVIMGAVDLLLGDRADKSSIRNGCDRCEISAEFQIPEMLRQTVHAILDEAAVEENLDNTLLIRRVITKSASRNFANGSPVTLHVLQQLGAILIDVHAANSSQSLLQTSEQLAVLDRFGHHQDLQNKVRTAWEALKKLRQEQEEFLQTLPSADEVKYLKRIAEEIARVAPEPGEDEALKARHSITANARSVMEFSYRAGEALAGDSEHSVFQQLTEIRRDLMDLEKYDPVNGNEFLVQLETITDQVRELSSNLESHASAVELDGNEFQAMEERMRILQTMKRRYGPTLEDVLKYQENVQEKVQRFEEAAMTREKFASDEKELRNVYLTAAAALSEKRKKTAGKLLKELSAETVKLGFKQAEFRIEWNDATESANGTDRMELLFSANPGVEPCPLSAVASSGEISRVMLAVKTVLSEADAVPVLIFDEIDANIGGETAWKVGQELEKLSAGKQILCISHLAQVAKFAQTHFLVEKSSEDSVTRTRITHLDTSARCQELARMLGGGKAALEHAKSLLEQA